MKIKRASPCAATMIPRGFEVPPAERFNHTAAARKNAFRSQILRTEAKLAREGKLTGLPRGWLFAGFHSEFEPTAELYQDHYHGIATGHMITVLDAMRESRLYKAEPGDRVLHRIRMSQQPLDNLAAVLTYLIQSYWPARPRGDGSDDEVGFRQLRRSKQRLPEPYHSQMLLWLDQQQIEDIVLMIGLRVGRDGFVKTYLDGEVCL